MGYEIQSDADKEAAQTLRWSWRAVTLPNGGNECADGKADSAADVYVFWKRGLRYYSLKYVWSAVGTKEAPSATSAETRSPRATRSSSSRAGPSTPGSPSRSDLKAEFRKHFADGKADADVPPSRASA